MQRLRVLTGMLLVVATVNVQAQAAPQQHRTANVYLKNGTITVWSVDSGGSRRVHTDARGLASDSVLTRERGGAWSDPADLAAFLANLALARIDQALAGDTIPELELTYASGFLRTAVVRCNALGCTLTITNRTPTGATRAGSWTSTRLSLGSTRELILAVLEAAQHATGAVFNYDGR